MNKKIILILSLATLFFGCSTSNATIKQYNEISTQHQTVSESAFKEFSEGIELFNNQKYTEAAEKGQRCYDSFTEAKSLSEQSKDLATKMKDKDWLAEFKDLSAQAEELRIQQCKYLKDVSNYSNDKNTEKAQETINKISELNDKFTKLQSTMDDIKNQHSDSFK